MDLATIATAVGMSSIVGSIVGFYARTLEIKFTKLNEEKRKRYESIISFMIIYLDPENIEHTHFEKKEILMQRGKEEMYKYISRELVGNYHYAHLYASNRVLKAYKRFLDNPNEENYHLVARRMRRSLWL